MRYLPDRRAPTATLAQVSSIVGNPILPLPKREPKQMLRGIGQLPELTLRNTNQIGDASRSRVDPSSARAAI